ncbi:MULTISPECIES: DUF2628 domain-containing protein [unclassified Methylophilus]|uniref:DUF2628 domain-containing protein n=1 Tax=unclassified Methylophilus TaxID=2630143 RepID=UPI000647CD63
MAKQLIIFRHPSGKVAKVTLGFSWLAFLLGPFWFLVKKMWVHFFVLLIVSLLLYLFSEYAEHIKSTSISLISSITLIAYAFVCGRYGNHWLQSSLLKRGYSPVMDQTVNA